MDEKIKISLPKSVLDTLQSDCKNFNVTKADGTPNFNAFVNTLIANYYEDFSASEESLYDDVKSILEPIPERYKQETFSKIVRIISKRDVAVVGNGSTTFSFKPNKTSEKAVTLIRNVILADESLSSFYRRMFVSYASKTQPQREIIVFRRNYEILQKAMKKGVQAYIDGKNDRFTASSIYGVFSAKEELYNYVLSTDGRSLFTIRLANVKDVSLSTKPASIPDDVKKIFDRQIRCGVQYQIFKGEEELIKVRFTDKGLYLFKKIYLYRPTPIKTEGNDYYFDCSTNQAIHYFKRLGYDAVITEPVSVAEMMKTFYSRAARKYNDVLKK